jgi:hypothetical protein
MIAVALITIVASLATQPVPLNHLQEFYAKTGVWGAWGPVSRAVAKVDPEFRRESTCARDLANVLCGLPLLVALYLGPMYLILHDTRKAVWCAVTVAVFAIRTKNNLQAETFS